MNEARGTLLPRPPFDFAKSLRYLSTFVPSVEEQVLGEGSIRRALDVDGRIVLFEVSALGSVEAPRLSYRLWSAAPLDAATRAEVTTRISRFLGLDDDLAPFYAIGRADPVFAPLVELLYGYHQVIFLTPFEAAVWAILAQRNQMVVTRRMKRALVEAYGGVVALDGQTYRAFPEAWRLATVPPEDLAATVRHTIKGGLLSELAFAFADVDEEFLRAAPYEEAERWLRGIRGIGAWSSRFILLRGLGRTERLPEGERRIQEAVWDHYGKGLPLANEEFDRLAARYGPWQGYWAHYLRVASAW